jgi:hypothetical protein
VHRERGRESAHRPVVVRGATVMAA